MKNAPVVQWIERQIPVLNVGGSSPFGRAKEQTNFDKKFVCSFFAPILSFTRMQKYCKLH